MRPPLDWGLEPPESLLTNGNASFGTARVPRPLPSRGTLAVRNVAVGQARHVAAHTLRRNIGRSEKRPAWSKLT